MPTQNAGTVVTTSDTSGHERRQTRGKLVAIAASLGPDYSIFVVFVGLLGILCAIYPAHFVWRTYTVELSAAIAFGMALLSLVKTAPKLLARVPGARQELWSTTSQAFKDWGPLFLLALVFANLEAFTGLIRTDVIDKTLYDIDVQIFGVEPTVWLSRLNWPLLTDWMSVSYSLYIATPLVLATALLLRGRRHHFREMSTAVILQMYVAFVLCLIFPAGPPRFYRPLVEGGFDPPMLSSYLGLYEAQQAGFDKADPLRTRSAFPSLHCSLGLFTLIFAWRYGEALFPKRPRLFFWICVPLVVSLWTSTIYLRHHWVVDIAAGLALGAFACMLAPRLRRSWPQPQH